MKKTTTKTRIRKEKPRRLKPLEFIKYSPTEKEWSAFKKRFSKDLERALECKIDKDSIPKDMLRPRRSQWQTVFGKKFSRLHVLSYAGSQNGNRTWKCICNCGNYIVVLGDKLLNGESKSCGCYKLEVFRKQTEKNKKPVLYKGKMYSKVDLAKKLGINVKCLKRRIKLGTPLDAKFGERRTLKQLSDAGHIPRKPWPCELIGTSKK